ncbi:MAG: homocysteine biosynthesis protein [Proteobacteria bacterium]|jgi:uncharacterized protein (DUF39 family)|nr:homocysteine biosynthesis protein [Pseudomonadota bacterium]
MAKSYEEINEKIRRGRAVVITAEEMIDVVRERGAGAAARDVDVVTTGTFGPMCSSGALLNVGHTTPRMKIRRARINGVEAYGGLAAVDLYLGAAQVRDGDPLNDGFPGRFEYGGGHAIEALVRGEEVELVAEAYGTDCYPRRELRSKLRLRDLRDAVLWNPRNAYQNYNVAVNAHGGREIYTYLGVLGPGLANATFCSAGQLSPLLNDPRYRTIGVGTRIFLGGGVGFVAGPGTQHDPDVPRTFGGAPKGGAGTLMVTGDLKRMSAGFLRGVSMVGYGTTLAVGVGVPIPILDEELALSTAVSDAELFAPVIDYSRDYPENRPEPLAYVTYAALRSGEISLGGRRVATASLSSYAKAREIAETLKSWIRAGSFRLGRPVAPLPGAREEEGGAP